MINNTQTVPLDVGIAIGRIMASREHRLYLRGKKKEGIRNASKNLAAAEKTVSRFGMYDDCGPSYWADLDEAKVLMRLAQSDMEILQKLEKYTKLLKHQFKETYPEWMVLLEHMLEEQTKKIQLKSKGK